MKISPAASFIIQAGYIIELRTETRSHCPISQIHSSLTYGRRSKWQIIRVG